MVVRMCVQCAPMPEMSPPDVQRSRVADSASTGRRASSSEQHVVPARALHVDASRGSAEDQASRVAQIVVHRLSSARPASVANEASNGSRIQRSARRTAASMTEPGAPSISRIRPSGRIARHFDTSQDPGNDPVVFQPAGAGPWLELDHESNALRHDVISQARSKVVRRNPMADVDAAWVLKLFVDQASRISKVWRPFHVHESQITALVTFVNEANRSWDAAFWQQMSPATSFEDAIRLLVRLAGDSDVALGYAKTILGFDFDKTGVRPRQLLASTTMAKTGAFWNPDKGSIFVSKALVDPEAILAAILFECGNAARAGRYAEVGTKFNGPIEQQAAAMEAAELRNDKPAIADAKQAGAELESNKSVENALIEFEVDMENQDKLRSARGVTTQRGLCTALGVTEEMLMSVTALHPGAVFVLPDRRLLRSQEARNALWWYAVERWPVSIQQQTWMAANHSELLGATGSLYK